jgi:hypothetical protein
MPSAIRNIVRTRPEVLCFPLAAVLLGLNVGPWGFGPNYLVTFVLYFTLQRSNVIFPITWSLSVALFVSTLWLILRTRRLNAARSFLVAGTLPFLAVAFFEVPCDLANWATYPGSGTTVFDIVSIVTWLALGFTSMGWWKVTQRYGVFVAGFLGGFFAWYAIGFPTIDRATGNALDLAFAFNIGLKIACFPLAAFPIWEELRQLRAPGMKPEEGLGVSVRSTAVSTDKSSE